MHETTDSKCINAIHNNNVCNFRAWVWMVFSTKYAKCLYYLNRNGQYKKKKGKKCKPAHTKKNEIEHITNNNLPKYDGIRLHRECGRMRRNAFFCVESKKKHTN